MNFFQRAISRFARTKAASGESYSTSDSRLSRILNSTPTASGQVVNDDTAMKLSAVFGCIRILSETIGALPYHIYRRNKSGTFEEADDHPLAEVLRIAPNSYMTQVDLKEVKTANLCLDGNTYSLKETRTDGSIISLTPLDSSKVDAYINKAGAIEYKVLDRGVWEVYPQEKIWHVRGFGRTGVKGLSPLGMAREALGAAQAQERFGALFFSQGGMPSGYVGIDKWLNTEQRDAARSNLQQLLGGLGNSHKWALMEGGMKPTALDSMPLEDMQFLVSRKFSIQEIARFYRIPPHMLADLERATFSNIEHQSQEFVMFTLMPYFTRFEASAQRWLFKAGERSDYALRFNFEGLLRADSASRSTFYSQMTQNGIMTRNEVRMKENLAPSDQEGMDGLTAQVNLTPIDKLGKTQPAPAAPFKSDSVPSIQVNAMPHSTDEFKRMLEDQLSGLPDILRKAKAPDVEPGLLVDLAEEMNQNSARMLSSINGVANVLRKSGEQNTKSISAIIEAMRQITAQHEKSMSELRDLVVADRMAILDDDGMPIGSRVIVAEPKKKKAVH